VGGGGGARPLPHGSRNASLPASRLHCPCIAQHTQLGHSKTTVSRSYAFVVLDVPRLRSSPFKLVNMSSTVVLASEVLESELENYVWVVQECKLLQFTHTAQSLFDALMRQKTRGMSAWSKQFTPIKVVCICALQQAVYIAKGLL
jgi:hypothetical protein